MTRARRGPIRYVGAALALAVLLGAALLDVTGPVFGQTPTPSPVPDNPIIRENLQPGSRDWQRPNPPKHASTGATSAESEAQGASGGGLASWEPDLISAYADRVTVAPGESLGIYVS